MTTEIIVSIVAVFLMAAWGVLIGFAEIGALKRRVNALERWGARHDRWHGENGGVWRWEPMSADGKMGRWQWVREVDK